MTLNEESLDTTRTKSDDVSYYVKLEEEKRALKARIKFIDKEQDDIYESVLNSVKEYGDENLKVTTRRAYGNWPTDILEKDEELKELKAQAKRVGNVDYEIKEYLSFISDAGSED